MTADRAANWCYGAALFTLPWAGVGLIQLTTGRDLGGGLQPAWLLLGLACALRAMAWLRRQDGPNTIGTWPTMWSWLAAAMMGSVLLSGFGIWIAPAGEPLDATLARFGKQVIQLLIMSVFVAWPALWTRGAARWRWTARCLVAGAVFQLAYGLLQEIHYFVPFGLLPWLERAFTSNPAILSGSEELYLGDRFLPVPRLRGTICEPLYLGNYLLLVLPLVPLAAWRARNRWSLTVGLVLLLWLTWSRGAWLGLGAAGALALVLAASAGFTGTTLRPYSRRLWRGLGLALGTCALLALLAWLLDWDGFWLPWRRLAQSFSTRDWSNLTRLYSMQAAWRAFQLSPVVGVGWGQFGWHFPVLVDPMGLQAMFTWPVVGNYPLKIVCETGLVGAGVGLVALVTQVRAFLTRRRERLKTATFTGSPLHLTSLALTGVAVQMLTFSQYNLPHIWVAWGLFLAALLPDTEAADAAKEGSRP